MSPERKQDRGRRAGKSAQKTLAAHKHTHAHMADTAQSQPLAGRTVAVTILEARQDPLDPDDDQHSSIHAGLPSQQALMGFARELGAHVSRTVHKRLDVLIASRAAVIAGTQRVRKANKLGVDIVTPEWLERCKEAGVWVSPTQCAHENVPTRGSGPSQPKTTTHASPPSSNEVTVAASTDSDDGSSALPAAWLGPPEWTSCYCACHDEDNAPPCCEWCHEGHPAADTNATNHTDTTTASSSAQAAVVRAYPLRGDPAQLTNRFANATSPMARRLAARVRSAAKLRYWEPTVVKL